MCHRMARCLGVRVAALCVLFGGPALAAELESLDRPIPEAEVNASRLLAIFRAAYVRCEPGVNGSLLIDEGGAKTIIAVVPGARVVSFARPYTLRPNVAELDKLRLLNRLNRSLVFVQFSLLEPATLLCQCHVPYGNGVRPSDLVTAYRLFGRVIESGVPVLDPEWIISRGPKVQAPARPRPVEREAGSGHVPPAPAAPQRVQPS